MKSLRMLFVAGALGLTATAATLLHRTEAAEDLAQTTYYASGQVQTRFEVGERGEKHGRFERFYADGTAQSQGAYLDGRMDGDWTFWNADGSVDEARSGSYVDGQRASE
jgi:antitoxin component YwqK of YwqJK toxin-antitoxin module